MSGYLRTDTLAALCTGPGGAISIVRLSGTRSFEILGSLTQKDPLTFVVRTASQCPIWVRTTAEGQELAAPRAIDDALILRFEGPKSFTGEDCVELHLHGSPYISSRVLEEIFRLGAKPALPGEFSFRAVQNGKLSITQAQAIRDLSSAGHDAAVSLALEKLSGLQNKALAALASDLRNLAVLGEVGIDFSDQDVEEVSLPALKRRIAPIFKTLKLLEDGFQRGVRVQDGVRVAFVGLPNAGKSSFFNTLLGEERSIVTEFAGTTRDVVHEKITLRSKSRSALLRLEDTAGLRSAEHLAEKIGIQRTLTAAKHADLVLFLLDSTQVVKPPQTQGDSRVSSGLAESCSTFLQLELDPAKTLLVFTKTDLIQSPEQIHSQLKSLVGEHPIGQTRSIAVSSTTGFGLSEATDLILDLCLKQTDRAPGEFLLTQMGQVLAVRAALEHLERAQNVMEIDLFAADVRQALFALNPLIGETLADDLLGRIFSDFCIGK